jgi:hypothetical protein
MQMLVCKNNMCVFTHTTAATQTQLVIARTAAKSDKCDAARENPHPRKVVVYSTGDLCRTVSVRQEQHTHSTAFSIAVGCQEASLATNSVMRLRTYSL